MNDKKKIIDKIRKCLALAGNNPDEAEAESAMRQAHKLLAIHNLTMIEIKDEKEVIQDSWETSFSSPWVRHIVSNIAKLYFCDLYYERFSKTKVIYQYVGTPENIEVSKEISIWIVKGVSKMAMKIAKKRGKEYSSFCGGASTKIRQRAIELIKESRREGIIEESTGKSLVVKSVYEQMDIRIKDWFKTQDIRLLSKAVSSYRGHGNLFKEGIEYGNKVNLNRQINNNSKISGALE